MKKAVIKSETRRKITFLLCKGGKFAPHKSGIILLLNNLRLAIRFFKKIVF